MKKKLVKVELLEKGDRVLLPSGEAIVVEDEKFVRFFGEVKIRWVDTVYEYKIGKKDLVYRQNCILMDKK